MSRSKLNDHRRRKISPETIFRCITSVIFGVLTQLALLLIPHFFGSVSLVTQLLLSSAMLFIAIIWGQISRRLLRIRASAPAFVMFHIVFVWIVYIFVIRQDVSLIMNVVFNVELAILLIGFFRMLSSDPGFVRNDSPDFAEDSGSQDASHSEASLSSRRIRYCRSCNVHVMGFDHHCPAFGNCIGDKNYALFMALLVGFILTEALYAFLSYQCLESNDISMGSWAKLAQSLAASTMLFSSFQVLWQVAFMVWHFYCVCFNIRTDEWVNWRKYPEFHSIIQPPSGQSSPETRFINPYDKGILCNLKELLLMT